MKGRKPIPTAIKKAKGTAQKCRILDDEVQPVKMDSLPNAPAWLDATGKKEWRHLVESLDRMGVLGKTDLSLLAIYCNEVSVYIEMDKILRDKSRVHFLRDESGAVTGSRIVAYQRIADNALKKALSLAAEFGFTPSARTRIGVGVSGKSDNTPKRIKIAR